MSLLTLIDQHLLHWGRRALVSSATALLAFVAGVSMPMHELRAGDPPVDPPPIDELPIEINAIGTVNPVPEAVEYGKLIRGQNTLGSLGPGLLGESVDYYTGQTDFVATDVSLPGNSALPVAVGRRYHVTNRLGGMPFSVFGDWELDIPHIEGVVATSVGWTTPVTQTDERCKYFGAPNNASVVTSTANGNVTTTIGAAQYNLGFTAVIPGYARHELLLRNSATPTQTGTNPVTTYDMWNVSCVQRNNSPVPGAPDEGFVITTPDGIKYTFRQGFIRDYSPLTRPADTAQSGINATLNRQEWWMMVTEVQDRFGNKVTYTYSQVLGVLNNYALTKISANDGRQIDLHYANGRIDYVSDGTRTWNYNYSSDGYLNLVTLPDNSKWDIQFANFNTKTWTYTSPTCTSLPSPSSSATVTGSIQHPSGAKGKFTFEPTRHGRSATPNTCLTNSNNVPFAPVEPAVYDVLSLKTKEITGPELPTLTWLMTYAGCGTSSCGSTKTTTVKDARGFYSLYTFGTAYNGNEGQLQRLQTGGSGSSYLSDESFEYFAANAGTYPALLGAPAQVRGDVAQLASLRPVYKRTLTLDDATYTQTMGNLDSYGFPKTITRQGTHTKTDTLTYAHNTNDWVLGTVKTITANGFAELDLTLNGHSQATQVRRFGQYTNTNQKYDYNGDGTLLSMRTGNGPETRYYDYYRGIPRHINYDDGSDEYVTVDNIGCIKSHTNAMAHTTNYDCDSMGRLKTISPPGYNSTTITWYPNASGWRRTTTRGGASVYDNFDAFLRPVKTYESAGHDVYRKFDPDGRMTFLSQPGSAFSGTTTKYDALGRFELSTDAESYQASATYDAHQLTMQDRNGNQTVYTLESYDDPASAWIKQIVEPSGTTIFYRDTWAKPKFIVRNGVTRQFEYSTGELLWKITEPETGVTTITYDGANRVDTVAHNGLATETHIYDLRNRLKDVTWSDTTLPTNFTWRKDGQPETATRGATKRTWIYDMTTDMLTGESVQINGTTYELGYDYDTNQHLKTITYPDSTSVALAPDVYGRQTSVGSYVSNVTYWDNDAIKGFNYGNGIAHSLTTQTPRGLPKDVIDGTVLNTTTIYDGAGNPKSITDNLNASNNRSMTYFRDRLATASGPWGASTLSYDDGNNLTGDTAGGGANTVTLHFDSSNRPYDITIGQGQTVTNVLTWDTRGRLSKNGPRNFTFDSEDRLLSVSDASRGPESYVYDALGFRVSKTNGSGTTQSVYDSTGALRYEYYRSIYDQGLHARPESANTATPDAIEPSSTRTKYYYLQSHLVAKSVYSVGITTTTYAHTDALGTPSVWTTSSGKSIATTMQLPYGNNPYSAGSSMGGGLGGEVGYAGQYADGTGLVYMRARYYDPQLRRFISPDPVGVGAADGANFNRYWYANNNPYRFYDPSGRQSAETCELVPEACQDRASYLGGVREVQSSIREKEEIADELATTAVKEAINPINYIAPEARVLKALATETKVARDLSAFERGRASEKRVLEDMGLAKNTKTVRTDEGAAIPDSLDDVQSVEIKDTRRVTNTQQVRIQTEAARESARKSILVTGKNTCVSKNCEFDEIIRRDDLGPDQN